MITQGVDILRICKEEMESGYSLLFSSCIAEVNEVSFGHDLTISLVQDCGELYLDYATLGLWLIRVENIVIIEYDLWF